MEGREGGEGSSTCDRRNWSELPRDVLILIFLKLGMMEVLGAAGSVCRSWQKVAKEEPVLWRRINMINFFYYGLAKFIHPTRLAIDRSGGQLEEFAADFADDDLLQYLCDRTNVLKKLVLISHGQLSAEAIAETAERQPLLEEIEITSESFNEKLIEIVGTACPHLKSFKLDHTCYNMNIRTPFEAWRSIVSINDVAVVKIDDEALGIAKTMHQLRHLELIDNSLTNEGLTAILDGCPHLETLYISKCSNVNMDADMDARCARLKTVRLNYFSDYDE